MKFKNFELNKDDIIVDNGNGVYILTQNDKEISYEDFYEASFSCYLLYERTQWGVDHFFIRDKIQKSELNSNIHLSQGNIKSKSTDDVTFLTWSLPSKTTCPYRTKECEKRCFAKKNETFKSVRDSRERNFEETKKDTFVRDMIKHLEFNLQKPSNIGKRIYVRIHTSGDFYNLDYLDKWAEIAKYFIGNGKILFQAYTKSIQYLWEWIAGEENEDFISNNDVEDALEELNIHIVYSIWHDSPIEDIELVENIGLQTFTALPKDEISKAIELGAFLCNGDCGNCQECYTGESEKIVIPYH